MGLGRQKEPVPCKDPSAGQPFDFLDETGRIHHRTAGNQTGNLRPQNTGRNKMQNILFPSDFHCVSRIVASLGSQNPIGLRCHDI